MNTVQTSIRRRALAAALLLLATTLLGVTRLAEPDALVEVEATAVA